MEFAHIEFSKLKISKTNMRYRDPPPDVADILPSIRAKGVLEPLLVRPEDGKYGVVAGRRRYFSLKAIKEEMGEEEDPPCAIMTEDDTCEGTASLFAQLLTLGDAEVGRIAAFFMAASLAVGGDVVDAVGLVLQIDPHAHWRPDDTFFDLLRDRACINALLAEVAGEPVAKANVAEKAKTQKQIMRDCLAGANGRTKVDGWLPGWMAFPPREIGQDAPQVTEPEQIVAE